MRSFGPILGLARDVVVLAVLAGAAALAAQDTGTETRAVAPSTGRIDTLSLENDARFLADDLLEGRHPASRGERIAALYIVSRLRALGVGPLPATDYRVPVPLTAVDVDEDAAVPRIDDDRGTREVRPPAFYHPGGARVAFQDFAGLGRYAELALEIGRALAGRRPAGGGLQRDPSARPASCGVGRRRVARAGPRR